MYINIIINDIPMMDHTEHKTIPWVEKYRPSNLNDIVLDPLNKTIIDNIIEKNHFPNILLYGPPGTGKTTTIINLVNKFQEKHNQQNKVSLQALRCNARGALQPVPGKSG